MAEKAIAMTTTAVVKLIRLVAGRIVASQEGSTQVKDTAKEVLDAIKDWR